jgi:hypothetical protein
MKKQLLVAQFAAEKPAEQSGRRKDFVFYSGAKIQRYDFWSDEEYTIQFSMKPSDFDFSLLNGGPLLKDHRMSVDTVVGHVENPRIEDGKAMGTAVFADDDNSLAVWSKVDAGHIKDVSMGVAIERLDLISDNKKDKIKDYMAFGWKPREISVVPDGADPAANFIMSREEAESLPADVRDFLRQMYQRQEFFNEIYEGRDVLRALTQQHLATAGAASTADNATRERTVALLQLRKRLYEYSHR